MRMTNYFPNKKKLKKDHDFGSSVMKSGLTPRATVLVNVSDHHHVVSERKSGAKIAVEYTFIQNRFIQMTFSSKFGKLFIQVLMRPKTFHPKTVSSKTTFIQTHIRPKYCRGGLRTRKSGVRRVGAEVEGPEV